MDDRDWVFAPPATPSLEVQGGGRFPLRRVFCVGRNYAAHTREMGGNPDREPPFFFTKPADAVVPGPEIPYPTQCAKLHHEVELVVGLGSGGTEIPTNSALDHVFGYAVGVDLTRRDMQDEAKALRRPWDLSKGFDASAPTGMIVPVASIGHPKSGAITLAVDGAIRQSGDLADMIWTVPEIIAYLSRLVALAPGDLIFTGTPDGVGPLARGAHVECRVENVGKLDFTIR